jgi:UDP-N-acetylglucosamine transferase subunit ALG13
MIFLTVGTHEPFTRLVSAFDAWCQSRSDCETFGQIIDPSLHGYRPQHFNWVPYLTPVEYDKQFRRADLIVSHAGMGSLITAMQYGKPIIVLPRRGHLHETRNDHQFATAKRFCDRPGVYVAMTENDLPGLLDRLSDQNEGFVIPTVDPFASPRMTEALRSFILGANVRPSGSDTKTD